MDSLREVDREALKVFNKLYGIPKTELEYESPFQLLIAVMLSAQSTDKKVNEVTKPLFKKYNSPLQLSKAKLDSVENIIREVNYYKTKAKHIIETSRLLVEHWHSEIPKKHEDLITLPGVGNKTANVILTELGLDYAFPVDTHVFRVSRKLGFAEGETREKVEKELCKRFPKKNWQNLHHWLIFHGRRVCKARQPLCGECALSKLCKYFISTVQNKKAPE